MKDAERRKFYVELNTRISELPADGGRDRKVKRVCGKKLVVECISKLWVSQQITVEISFC